MLGFGLAVIAELLGVAPAMTALQCSSAAPRRWRLRSWTRDGRRGRAAALRDGERAARDLGAHHGWPRAREGANGRERAHSKPPSPVRGCSGVRWRRGTSARHRGRPPRRRRDRSDHDRGLFVPGGRVIKKDVEQANDGARAGRRGSRGRAPSPRSSSSVAIVGRRRCGRGLRRDARRAIARRSRALDRVAAGRTSSSRSRSTCRRIMEDRTTKSRGRREAGRRTRHDPVAPRRR